MLDLGALLVPRPAPTVLFESASRFGEAVRFYGPEPVSWKDYAQKVRSLGSALLAQGVERGESVVLCAHNSVDWASASLAIQSVGAVLVPIYPGSTCKQRDYIIEHSEARLVFDDSGLQNLRAPQESLPWADCRDTQGSEEFGERLNRLALSDTAMMLYTSGTTGKPKGVPLTHANVAKNASDWIECTAPLLHEGAVDLLWLPMSHIFGFGELCLGNALGFTTHLASPKDALSMMPDLKPTVFMSVPAYWEKLASQAHGGEDPARELRKLTGDRLRLCLSGGAGLKQGVKELFHSIGCLIVEGYGLTECAPTLTLNRPGDYRFDSVGKALPSVSLRISEDSEIQAKGPNVFSGYFKDPEASKAAFTTDNWFRTGDLGTLDEDGFLRIIGRQKEILVTAGGKNIPPANIEMLFADDPFVEHLVVYGDARKYLVAAIWPNMANIRAHCGPSSGADEVRELLENRVHVANQSLARFETIKSFAVMDSPLSVENELLTASLKIRRNKIYEVHRETFEGLY